MYKKLFFLAINLLSMQAFAIENFWKNITPPQMRGITNRAVMPQKFQAVQLNDKAFLDYAWNFISQKREQNIIIPLPDGSYKTFVIKESPVMSAGLASKYSLFKTWAGYEKENPANTIRLDWTTAGLHAMIFSTTYGMVIIDPFTKNNLTDYIVYFRKDIQKKGVFIEEEIEDEEHAIDFTQLKTALIPVGCVGTELRTYRLSVSCTGEYGRAVGATTVEEALAAIVTSVNRVNGVYENELAIRLVLIDNNDKVVFIDPATDPFTANNNGPVLLSQNQRVTDDSIGTENYDIGHIFSTGGGGVASLACVCRSTTKARGVTGLPNPVGDPFDIDYVAHEIGHQFGGNHTFNAATGACRGNGSRSANVEPGSGSTIMSYAGICDANNLQNNSDPFFSAISRDEIARYTITQTGNTCALITPTANAVPIVDAGADYAIPANTPFQLTGTATDSDGDPLTYFWEQMDRGASFGNWDKPTGNAPLFRAFFPIAEPERIFPQLTDLQLNINSTGEILPNYARTINMRLTARDNKTGGSGICYDEKILTVVSTAGPFVLRTGNTGTVWGSGDNVTINWDVANTDMAPINVTKVNILLSVDGGFTFPYTLASETDNGGVEFVTLPLLQTTSNFVRLKVEAVGNVFFDISNIDITIQKALPVNWLSVTAEKSGSQSAIIKWSTASEINNDYFEIQRSLDGNRFTPIGKQTAGSNANQVQQYSFNDVRLPMGTFLYRIKQVDRDGKFSFSQTVQVTIDANGVSWIITPNPASDETAVLFNKSLTGVQVTVTDANGRIVFSKAEKTVSAGATMRLPARTLANGIYLVKVLSGGNTDVQKLLIKR